MRTVWCRKTWTRCGQPSRCHSPHRPLTSSCSQLFETPAAFAAAPDVFPPDKFNAGVMVVTPDQSVLTAMLAAASTLPSHDGGDTGMATRRCFCVVDSLSRLPPLQVS